MILTLCGSARFEEAFKKWNLGLTLSGHVVHTLAAFPSDMGGKDWYTEEQKRILDQVYLLKIENSEAIVVINVGLYCGEGTVREIVYARELGKPVYYIEDVGDVDLLATQLLEGSL